MASKKRLNKIAREGGYNIKHNNPHLLRKEARMDYNRANEIMMKLKDETDFIKLTDGISTLMADKETTLADLIEALRLCNEEFLIEQATLTLHKRTKRKKDPQNLQTDWKDWLDYIMKNPDIIPLHELDDNTHGNWTSYLRMLQNAGVIDDASTGL